MKDLLLLLVFVMFMAVGLLAPFVWGLGYIWVDVLVPHMISYSLLSGMPVAFIMGAGAFVSYLLFDRRSPPRISALHVLCLLMAIWITLTATWAVAPDAAWTKWNPSVKVVAFAAFMPFMFRSRVQIEAYLLVLILSAAGHLLPWGLKTLVTGGGYNQALGLLDVNGTILAESSSVAAISIMFVPFLAWVRTHSLIIPWQKARTGLASFLTVSYLVASIGTFARTGLVGLAVLGVGMLIRSKRKILFILLALVMGGVMFAVTSDKWFARIDTIADYNEESSALVRLLVWQWTVGFALEHPFGGGFNSYLTNTINLDTGPDGLPFIEHGRAFHSIYFAVLGEHGFPGLALYLLIMALCLFTMQRVIRRCRGRPDLAWAADLARASQLGLLIIMACGNFVDLSFLFVIWDIVALILCLNAHVHRVLRASEALRTVPARPDTLAPPVAAIARRPAF